MFRAILYLIVTALVISVVRSVLGMISKAFSEAFQAQSPPAQARRASVPTGGELKKDPVCGTFISTETAFQKAVGGQTYYFCSTQCRDKFKG